ncbi:glutamyl-tRNA reductase [Corallincola luteus]|uniref:Glutamyl-tRNA reductase n=1 Tax=Corallincola luteus TaxID=1775177 RepID=A0ABY2AJM7_9GAMM|nr:glutamyl-tRNA reductase [Corallincola luteus]TCI02978.1 glutamyl-tRNA reductase [Corallincola luteus]
MALYAFGINHKTASVSVREQVAFSPDTLVDATRALQANNGVHEAAIVSTCNRTEIYCHADGGLAENLAAWWANYHGLPQELLNDCLYQYQDNDAVRHLMRVASGLDSLVLGEPQILGQAKQAYASARAANTLGTILDRLFQQAFSVAKRVRSETEIGASAVSVAYAAVNLAKHIFGSLDKSRVMLVGAGETIELVAQHLAEQGVRQIVVANRTVPRALELADRFHGEALTLSQIPERMAGADIVISSTAAPLPIIGTGMVSAALAERKRAPMLLVDLAVPRDIEAQVGDLDDAYLYTVDDLQGIVEQNVASRQEAAAEGEQIIADYVVAFEGWLRGQSAVDTIRSYRQLAEETRDELLERALKNLQSGVSPEQVLNELAYKLTNRLIHSPTRALTDAGQAGELEKLNLIRDVLGLDLIKNG